MTNNQNKKILLVEDEFFITELYLRALRKKGFQIDNVANGLEANKLAKTDQYDIIILDLMIPGMNGIDILNDLKNNYNLKAKIIIATNLEERKEVKESIEKKADGNIIKANLTPAELAEFIENIK